MNLRQMTKKLEIAYGKSYGTALFYAVRDHYYDGDFIIGFNLPGDRAGRYLNFHSGDSARAKHIEMRKRFMAPYHYDK